MVDFSYGNTFKIWQYDGLRKEMSLSLVADNIHVRVEN
jgi:hypothetical protein